VAAGTRVIVDMTSGFDNYLQLLDANGNIVTQNDDFNGLNARLDFIYQEGYRVRATSYSGGLGSYTLAATAVTNTVTGLAVGSSLSGTLTTSDAANSLRRGYRSDDFDLQSVAAGTRVIVDMTSGFDNYLQLLDANGSVIAENDDFNGLNARLDFIYQEGYRVRATSYSGALGSYTISTSSRTETNAATSAWDPLTNTRSNIVERGLASEQARGIDFLTGIDEQSQLFFIANNSSNPYYRPSDKAGLATGLLDSEFAIVQNLTLQDSIGLSSAARSQYSIRQTDYSSLGVGYGVYQNNDLVAMIYSEDRALRSVFDQGNNALTNNLFRYS